jgi:hypothetical protein
VRLKSMRKTPSEKGRVKDQARHESAFKRKQINRQIDRQTDKEVKVFQQRRGHEIRRRRSQILNKSWLIYNTIEKDENKKTKLAILWRFSKLSFKLNLEKKNCE